MPSDKGANARTTAVTASHLPGKTRVQLLYKELKSNGSEWTQEKNELTSTQEPILFTRPFLQYGIAESNKMASAVADERDANSVIREDRAYAHA